MLWKIAFGANVFAVLFNIVWCFLFPEYTHTYLMNAALNTLVAALLWKVR